jgi:hypothetical protein
MKRRQHFQLSTVESLESRTLQSVTVLLADGFGAGRLNRAVWHQPAAGPASYLGRTQLMVAGKSAVPTETHGALILPLQSYNRTQLKGSPSFWGGEIISNKSFTITPGQTTDIQLRAKLNMSVAGGVLGMFLYQYSPDGTHDEIDFEDLSGQIANGGNQVETNVFAEQPLGAGSAQQVNLPSGGTLSTWHTYEIKLDGGVSSGGVTLEPPSVSWLIDGVTARSETDLVPDRPMQLYVNFWAPAAEWPQAYNPAIQPVARPLKNQVWTANIDSASVTTSPDSIPAAVQGASTN